jgi:hypothetical protein
MCWLLLLQASSATRGRALSGSRAGTVSCARRAGGSATSHAAGRSARSAASRRTRPTTRRSMCVAPLRWAGRRATCPRGAEVVSINQVMFKLCGLSVQRGWLAASENGSSSSHLHQPEIEPHQTSDWAANRPLSAHRPPHTHAPCRDARGRCPPADRVRFPLGTSIEC